jgi:hypothetical protein
MADTKTASKKPARKSKATTSKSTRRIPAPEQPVRTRRRASSNGSKRTTGERVKAWTEKHVAVWVEKDTHAALTRFRDQLVKKTGTKVSNSGAIAEALKLASAKS